ncbi:fibronectin type III domain-containing protein [bacterium]|nr:MAG: fibronectin type III domain-containing protein [bacterium]
MKRSRIFIPVLLALTAGVFFSCKDDKPPQLDPPRAPILLAILSIGQTSVEMSWSDQSPDENGFRIERKTAAGNWETDGEVGVNVTYYAAIGLTPSTEYSFRVFSFNDAGDSDSSSNVRTITTLSNVLPPIPTLVQGTATSTTSIHVTWHKQGEPDSFQVDRRTSSGDWIELTTVSADVEQYDDTGLTPHTTYYYRVGAMNEAGTAWSEESDPVTTPIEGAPNAPSNLVAEAVMGIGVTLTWTDNSVNEDGFYLYRNISGQQFQKIDSVEADITTYFDAIGDAENIYTYRVRAFNEFGMSSEAQSAPVNYKYCSDGIIPICLGNEWRYNVEENGQDPFELRRDIVQVGYIQGYDHYLVIEYPFPIGDAVIDSTIYLRNFEGEGCKAAPFPLSGSVTSQLLFRYPIGSLGSHYFYRGDSILVISTGTTKVVGDHTFDGVVGYQRFLHGQGRSIRYWLKPGDVGIILEEEVVSSQIVLTREINDWIINN